MCEMLNKEDVNTKRQYNLDILKTIAVISMIMAHAIVLLGRHRPGFENEFLYKLGEYFFADYLAVAHAFMFALGVGLIFTRNNDPKNLIRRGFKIYLMGYALNFFRYGIYNLLGALVVGKLTQSFWNSLFEQDILQFAGLAMIVTGIFKMLKLDIKVILIFSIVLSAIGSCISYFDTGNYALNLIVGHFVATTDISNFVFFNWYIYVALGMLFGRIIRRVSNLDAFYKKLLYISGAISVIYILLTVKYGVFFLSKSNRYYSHSTLEAFALLSLDMFILSAVYFITDKIGDRLLEFCTITSRKVNEMYIIHWIILGFIDCVFCFGMGVVMPYSLIYVIGILLVVASYIIAGKKRKKPINNVSTQ